MYKRVKVVLEPADAAGGQLNDEIDGGTKIFVDEPADAQPESNLRSAMLIGLASLESGSSADQFPVFAVAKKLAEVDAEAVAQAALGNLTPQALVRVVASACGRTPQAYRHAVVAAATCPVQPSPLVWQPVKPRPKRARDATLQAKLDSLTLPTSAAAKEFFESIKGRAKAAWGKAAWGSEPPTGSVFESATVANVGLSGGNLPGHPFTVVVDSGLSTSVAVNKEDLVNRLDLDNDDYGLYRMETLADETWAWLTPVTVTIEGTQLSVIAAGLDSIETGTVYVGSCIIRDLSWKVCRGHFAGGQPGGWPAGLAGVVNGGQPGTETVIRQRTETEFRQDVQQSAAYNDAKTRMADSLKLVERLASQQEWADVEATACTSLVFARFYGTDLQRTLLHYFAAKAMCEQHKKNPGLAQIQKCIALGGNNRKREALRVALTALP